MLDDWEDNLVDNELNGLRIAKSKRLRKKIGIYMYVADERPITLYT